MKPEVKVKACGPSRTASEGGMSGLGGGLTPYVLLGDLGSRTGEQRGE